MTSGTAGGDVGSAAERLGDEPTLRLLQELVAIAPTNLEDLAADRFEKPNYRRAADAIVRWARSCGLATRVFDALLESPPEIAKELRGIPRPNVVVDLDRGTAETVLVLAHYDVVPVPVEQRARWTSPPHTLTLRANGRLYGRGANDDLGSGVAATLLALRRLAEVDRLERSVRLLVCCDEETGGEGGIEALRAHDAGLPPNDPERFIRADVALIPDGSPHATAGSSGVAFLEASRSPPGTLLDAIDYGESLVHLYELARTWRSVYVSPDWPDRDAPEPVITGRASVTRLELTTEGAASAVRLAAAHAETEAANQVARAVTLVFEGPREQLAGLRSRLAPLVAAPFHLEEATATALSVPPGALALQLIGVATHGGYPHRGHNPVPEALRLLRAAADVGLLAPGTLRAAKFTVDLRLPPEMELADGIERATDEARLRTAARHPSAELVAPPARCRPGYALSPDHPAAVKLARIVAQVLGEGKVYGEYGGTDASSLRGLTTPSGAPLPALVFGSMDPLANIHDVDESADPRLIAGVARTIERFVLEP